MSETPATQAAPAQPTVRANAFAGLWKVFASPSEFFDKIKHDPKILVPYIMLLIVSLALFYFMAPYLSEMQMEQIMEQQGEEAAQQIDPGMMRMFTILGGTVSMMLAPLLLAGLAIFFGNFVMAGEASFGKILSVMLYGEFLYMVGSLLHLPLIIAKDSIAVSYSLAALLPDPDVTSATYVALSKISVFHIWEIIVVGIGLAAVYNFPRNKGYVLAVLSVGLVSLIHVLSTVLFS